MRSEIEVLGVAIARMTRTEALQEIERIALGDDPGLIAYANAHTLNLAHEDPAYKGTLNDAALVLNDGSGVALAARDLGAAIPREPERE